MSKAPASINKEMQKAIAHQEGNAHGVKTYTPSAIEIQTIRNCIEFPVDAKSMQEMLRLADGIDHEKLIASWKPAAEMLRKSWRMRRLLDFSRPYEIPARLYRHIREQRRKIVRNINHKIIFESSSSIEEYHRRRREWDKVNLPKGGRPVTFNANFVAEVNAWRDRLVGRQPISPTVHVRTHRISPLRNQPGTIKDAIKSYLTTHYGRQPTVKEIANAQAVYSQRRGKR